MLVQAQARGGHSGAPSKVPKGGPSGRSGPVISPRLAASLGLDERELERAAAQQRRHDRRREAQRCAAAAAASGGSQGAVRILRFYLHLL